MIFAPEMVRKILSGRKTETRRPVKVGETTCRYKRGKDYAVQRKEGGRATVRIEILGAERQRLGDITYESARREGFKTTDDFREYWIGLYGVHDPDQEVWAIMFRVEGDAPLYLSKKCPPDYVRDANLGLTDEPEPVAPGEVEDCRASKDAKVNYDREHRREQHERELRSLINRLRQADRQAMLAGLETETVSRLRQQVEQIEQDIAALG